MWTGCRCSSLTFTTGWFPYTLAPPFASTLCPRGLELVHSPCCWRLPLGACHGGALHAHPRSLWSDFSFWEEGVLMEGTGSLICSNLCFLLDESL